MAYVKIMAKLKILEFPDARLRNKATPVEVVDDELRALIGDMFETMYAQFYSNPAILIRHISAWMY